MVLRLGAMSEGRRPKSERNPKSEGRRLTTVRSSEVLGFMPFRIMHLFRALGRGIGLSPSCFALHHVDVVDDQIEDVDALLRIYGGIQAAQHAVGPGFVYT